MGEGVRETLDRLKRDQPIGIEIGEINFQPEAVTAATGDFVFNLVKAVSIVIVVLLFAMGRKTGLIIGLVLFLTIMATFLVMFMEGSLLMERISLGALIIALCMLTDNAIIMIEGIKVRIEAGEDKTGSRSRCRGTESMAAVRSDRDRRDRLRGDWAVGGSHRGIHQFAVLGDSDRPEFELDFLGHGDALVGLSVFQAAGEGCERSAAGRSLWGTDLPSLSFAVDSGAAISLVGDGRFVDRICGVALWLHEGRPEFLPAGHTSAIHGRRVPARRDAHSRDRSVCRRDRDYLLPKTVSSTSPLSSVAGACDSYWSIHRSQRIGPSFNSSSRWTIQTRSTMLRDGIQEHLDSQYPDANAIAKKFLLGPGAGGRVQARISGPDPAVLRSLADQAIEVLDQAGGTQRGAARLARA